MLSEPFGLSSGSKTIAKIILIRIRYSICESKHLVSSGGSDFLSHKYSIRDSKADKGNCYQGDNVGNYHINTL